MAGEPGAGEIRDPACRSVGEEVERQKCQGKNRRGEGETAERHGAEVADDGGIDEDVEGFCRERDDSRQRQPEDFPVVLVSTHESQPRETWSQASGAGEVDQPVKVRAELRAWPSW